MKVKTQAGRKQELKLVPRLVDFSFTEKWRHDTHLKSLPTILHAFESLYISKVSQDIILEMS